MRLDVDETGVEQLFGPVDREGFDLIRRGAALIIAAAGIALGIFVGEDAALRFEYRFRDDILRRDQFDLILLAFEFMLHRRRDRGVDGDRKSVVSGKSVSVRVDLGGWRTIKKKKN